MKMGDRVAIKGFGSSDAFHRRQEQLIGRVGTISRNPSRNWTHPHRNRDSWVCHILFDNSFDGYRSEVFFVEIFLERIEDEKPSSDGR